MQRSREVGFAGISLVLIDSASSDVHASHGIHVDSHLQQKEEVALPALVRAAVCSSLVFLALWSILSAQIDSTASISWLPFDRKDAHLMPDTLPATSQPAATKPILPVITVAQLHAQLQSLMDRGMGNLPVCATDCRAFYPFQAYTTLNPSGYTDALLINVRPDARFCAPANPPVGWNLGRIEEWNHEADAVAARCGAFA